MSNIDYFVNKPCEKIDANCVNAYMELSYDDESATSLVLKNSWGDTSLDLRPMMRATQTTTYLELSPDVSPSALQYTREDGEIDCISGNDLSRIVSMKLLRDVDQNTPAVEGDVYMAKEDGYFYTYNLLAKINELNNKIDALERRVEALEDA